MSEIFGKIVSCERCGEQIFLKCIGEEEFDGGYTRFNKFESFPDGWELSRIAYPEVTYMRTCPKCSAFWEKCRIKAIEMWEAGEERQ